MHRIRSLLAVLIVLALPTVALASPGPASGLYLDSAPATLLASPGIVHALPTLYAAPLAVEQAPVVAAVNPDDLQGTAMALLTAITSSNWALVAVLAIVLITLTLRRWGGQYVPALRSRWAGVLLPLLGSAAGAVATALLGGAPLTVALVVNALFVGLGAIGLFSAGKNTAQALQAATVAGQVAAEHVTSKADAVKVLGSRH